MELHVLKSKIHKARITQSELHYEGSLGLDLDLMDAAGILPYEKLLIVNATNGERLETYAIPEARGSRTVCLNGAAARRGMVGDVVTIMAFAVCSVDEAQTACPCVILLDENNGIVRQRGCGQGLEDSTNGE